MLERILDFLKNKYFIGGITLVALIFIGSSVMNYYSEKANEAEFRKFVKINEEFSIEESNSNELFNNLDLNFDSFGYELITKTVLAKKAVDEANFDLALNLFLEMYQLVKSERISKVTKNILEEQYAENIVRIYMEKNDFVGGSNFIKENTINSLRFHELAGDFYKFFEKNKDSVFHYNQALTFDLDETQKNIINLKKPKE
tara:strand:+ start:1192 stop:1794 length:603 start_codon:yes stop_codon:yes gene_type:complete